MAKRELPSRLLLSGKVEHLLSSPEDLALLRQKAKANNQTMSQYFAGGRPVTTPDERKKVLAMLKADPRYQQVIENRMLHGDPDIRLVALLNLVRNDGWCMIPVPNFSDDRWASIRIDTRAAHRDRMLAEAFRAQFERLATAQDVSLPTRVRWNSGDFTVAPRRIAQLVWAWRLFDAELLMLKERKARVFVCSTCGSVNVNEPGRRGRRCQYCVPDHEASRSPEQVAARVKAHRAIDKKRNEDALRQVRASLRRRNE